MISRPKRMGWLRGGCPTGILGAMRVTRTPILIVVALLIVGCQPTARLPSPTAAPTFTAVPTASATPSSSVMPTPTATVRRTADPAPPPAVTPSPIATPTASSEVSPSPTIGFAPSGPTTEARVSRVVDGDTIRVAYGGQRYALRYIGIDTPETVHPSRPVEWMGREASAANRQLVDGRTVVLEKDVSETDRYGRLLRYVWLREGDGWLLVNLELVRRGFAQVSTYPPDVKYTDLFLDAQRAARDQELGLWGQPTDDDDGEQPADSEPDRGSGGTGGTGSCDPAYPGVCIPPSPPDLNCGDIEHRRFKVLPRIPTASTSTATVWVARAAS